MLDTNTAFVGGYERFSAQALAADFSDELIAKIEPRINELPIAAHLGICARIARSGVVTAELNGLQPFHLGGRGDGLALNGAVIMGLLYCAIISPALAHALGADCTTLELNVRLANAVEPREVRAVGCAVSRSRQFIHANAAIFDWRGEPHILASGIVQRGRTPVVAGDAHGA
jgi:acyl-coenzyme A thioesterase PaaI-like protein